MLIALLASVVGALSVLLYFSQILEPEYLRGTGRRIRHWQFSIWQMMATVLVAALLFHMFTSPDGYISFWFLCLGFLIWFVRSWQREFMFLMGLKDADFPGRHDKMIWAIMLSAFAPIGVWFFRAYRLAHWPAPAPAVEGEGDTATQPA